MSELIPEITITEFRKLINGKKAHELKELASFEIVSNGEYLWTIISVPANGDSTTREAIKVTAEYLGVRANTVGGKNPAEVADAIV